MLDDSGAMPFGGSVLDGLLPQLKAIADFATENVLRDAIRPVAAAVTTGLAAPAAKAAAQLNAAITPSTRAALTSGLNVASPAAEAAAQLSAMNTASTRAVVASGVDAGSSSSALAGIASQMQSYRASLIEQAVGPALKPAAASSLLVGVRDMIKPMHAWRESFAASASWAATHSSASHEIAAIMQRLAELRVLPRQQGLARGARRLWDRALEAAREASRRAVGALTGKRTDVNPELRRPSRQRGPDGRNKRRSLLVLLFTETHYVIRELLIRAPGFGGLSRRTRSCTSGELLCVMKTTTTCPRAPATARLATRMEAAA